MSGDNPFGSDDLSASTSGADSFHGAAGARLMETSFGGDNPFAAAQDDEEVRPSARARPRERRAVAPRPLAPRPLAPARSRRVDEMFQIHAALTTSRPSSPIRRIRPTRSTP